MPLSFPTAVRTNRRTALGGQTPLQAAQTPAMDAIALAGVVGRSNNVPVHLHAGFRRGQHESAGLRPVDQFFTGRAPLEAAAQGIALGGGRLGDSLQSGHHSRPGHARFHGRIIFLRGSEASLADLLTAVAHSAATDATTALEFIPGVSYRNLLLYRGQDAVPPFARRHTATPPHDLTDKSVIDDYPRGAGSDLLVRLMSRSVEVFADHPVNRQRIADGKLPATNVWLWGLGQTPHLTPFSERLWLCEER